MSSQPSPDVAALVERFFLHRAEGRRVSVDEVLAEHNAGSDARTRAALIADISQVSRSSSYRSHVPEGGRMSAAAAPVGIGLQEIPGYDLIELIGRGGMGVVYEAYQRSTGRRVAVKVISEQFVESESARWRFEREVELVARLQHPNIVSVVDSGICQGCPYYVMEYVDGRTLDEHIRNAEKSKSRKVETADVLRLMAIVCDAVEYAHQRGVLHRDLKPSNILIDLRGQPHILDFGLAKDIDPLGESKAGALPSQRRALTVAEPGQILGTLAYMAPEQARGAHEEMSVRSDVYSLGAIAYEAITGRLPCLTGGALHDVLERIQRQDPPQPSSLEAEIPDDVDAILLKALDKTPERRYATAGELAADFRHWLADEPVEARPASALYQFRKFAQRNRALVAGVAVALTLLILGTIGTSWQAYRATKAERMALSQRDQIAQERDKARKERDRAQALAGAVVGMIRLADDVAARIDSVEGLRKQVDSGVERVKAALPNEPELVSAVHMLAGVMYYALGDYTGADGQMRMTAELRSASLGPEHPSTLLAQQAVGWTLYAQNRPGEAEQLLNKTLSIQLRLFGKLDPGTLSTRLSLAQVLTGSGHYAAAETMLREIIDDCKGSEVAHRRVTLRAMISMVAVFEPLQKSAQLEELLQALLKNRRSELTDSEAFRFIDLLGQVYMAQRKYEDAEPIIREEMELAAKIFSVDDERKSYSTSYYGECLTGSGRFADAERNLIDSYEKQRDRLGESHAWTKLTRERLVQLYEAWSKAKPGKGYDAKAAEWREKLARLQATTQPAASQPAKS